MFQPNDIVRIRGRLFVVVAVSKDGSKVTVRDDEGEYLTVRASQVSPA
jgi:hypothetical protein